MLAGSQEASSSKLQEAIEAWVSQGNGPVELDLSITPALNFGELGGFSGLPIVPTWP